jgi:hypothetical protein
MAKQGKSRRDKAAADMDGVTVDPYRAFVFPNRMREQRRARGYPKLLPLSGSIPEIPYIRLSKIERGEVVARPDELRRIAATLGIAPADLLLDVDAPAYDIARWAEPFFDVSQIDRTEERFAVLLGAALRARRTNDPALTIAILDRDFHLPPVNLSRIENALKPFARWNAAAHEALYAIFGVADEPGLRAHVEAQYRCGALGPFLADTDNPSIRHERTRARIAQLAAALDSDADEAPLEAAPPATGGRSIPVHGAPLPGGLIADTPTGDCVEAPRTAGPRAFGLRIGRASLGGGMPAQSMVIADPDRFPTPGGLALLREAEGWRLLAIASGRDGRMIGYSTHPDIERPIDECDPAAIAAVIAAHFI